MNGGPHHSKSVGRNAEDFAQRGLIFFSEQYVANLDHLHDLMTTRQGMLQLKPASWLIFLAIHANSEHPAKPLLDPLPLNGLTGM